MAATNLILYADDDIDDRSWVTEAFAQLDSSVVVRFVEKGTEVVSFLQSEAEAPSLIVLDLNMPEMDGRQTLKFIKDHPQFYTIPVVVVSTSANPIDKQVCVRLGASLYLVKPNTHNGWKSIVGQLQPFVQ